MDLRFIRDAWNVLRAKKALEKAMLDDKPAPRPAGTLPPGTAVVPAPPPYNPTTTILKGIGALLYAMVIALIPAIVAYLSDTTAVSQLLFEHGVSIAVAGAIAALLKAATTMLSNYLKNKDN